MQTLFDAPEPTRPPGRLRREVDAKRRLRKAKAALRAETNTRSEVKRGAREDMPPELAELRSLLLSAPRGSEESVERYFDYQSRRDEWRAQQ